MNSIVLSITALRLQQSYIMPVLNTWMSNDCASHKINVCRQKTANTLYKSSTLRVVASNVFCHKFVMLMSRQNCGM